MSQKIKGADGKEIEVFTKAELDAEVKKATDVATAASSKVADDAAKAAIEAYKVSNPDQTKVIEKLKDDLSQAEAKLTQALSYDDKSGNRDEQITRLRKEKDEAVEKLTKQVTDLTTTIQKGQQDAIAGTKTALLDKLVGKDVEARKKVELEFDAYKANETSPEQMESRMKNAILISGVKVEPTPGPLDGRSSAGDKGEGSFGGKAPVVTDNAVKMGAAMGVSKEELDKAAADIAAKAAK